MGNHIKIMELITVAVAVAVAAKNSIRRHFARKRGKAAVRKIFNRRVEEWRRTRSPDTTMIKVIG